MSLAGHAARHHLCEHIDDLELSDVLKIVDVDVLGSNDEYGARAAIYSALLFPCTLPLEEEKFEAKGRYATRRREPDHRMGLRADTPYI
eukprot:51325-Pleurochrysis_carterae.AAC.1